MGWLDQVASGGDAYVLDGEIFCGDCGRREVEGVTKKIARGMADEEDLPQGPFPDGGGEADNCQFCGNGGHCVNAAHVGSRKTGMPLANPLTRDGQELLQKDLRELMVGGTKYQRMLGRLLRRVWGDYVEISRPTRLAMTIPFENWPPSLKKAMSAHHRANQGGKGFDGRFFADADALYALHYNRGSVDFCRSEVGDDGEFGKMVAVTMPDEACRGRDPEEVLADVADGGGWN